MKTVQERFESKFIPEPNTGCWMWIGAIWGNNGYGSFHNEGKNHQAHVAAAEIYLGEKPLGRKRLHRCDVSWCVNPIHGFWGTQKDNMADAARKGRRGNSLANLKPEYGFKAFRLDAQKVREIRNSPERNFILAKRYDVAKETIRAVRLRKIWNSLPD